MKRFLGSGWMFLALALWAGNGARAADRPFELWLYCSQNLWVDANIIKLEELWSRASRAGYTHILLADSKFGKLGDMDARYFRNVERLKASARANHLEIVPALFGIGYSNDLLWNDPNLVEAMPVKDLLLEVRQGEAILPAKTNLLRGGDFSNLTLWSWRDPNVQSRNGAAWISEPAGENARIVQKIKLAPYHQYHFSVRIKTRGFRGLPEAKILSGNRALDYNHLGVAETQDWKTHHLTFNSLDHTEASLYIGAWGARSGEMWIDDAVLEEAAFVNLVRRPGTPLTIQTGEGRTLAEGKDYEPLIDPRMGNHSWKGSYDTWHEPPKLRVKLPDGTKLRASFYHAVTVHDDQANICPSEPKTVEILRDQAQRMHAAWQARGYMMSHDEIRVWNWCAACENRHLDAGALLADNVKTCISILRQVNPGGRIHVWSDMFDPNHNARNNYYLVRGDLRGSWDGLDPEVIVVPWYFEKRRESLRFFAQRGHSQVIAGYYDHQPAQAKDWLAASQDLPGTRGIMYTTWEHKYTDLETFAAFALGKQ